MVEIVTSPTALTVVSHGERGRPAENLGVKAYFDFEHLLTQIRADQPKTAASLTAPLPETAVAVSAPQQDVLPRHETFDFTVHNLDTPHVRDAASFVPAMPELLQAPLIDETPPEDAWFENRTRLRLMGIALP